MSECSICRTTGTTRVLPAGEVRLWPCACGRVVFYVDGNLQPEALDPACVSAEAARAFHGLPLPLTQGAVLAESAMTALRTLGPLPDAFPAERKPAPRLRLVWDADKGGGA